MPGGSLDGGTGSEAQPKGLWLSIYQVGQDLVEARGRVRCSPLLKEDLGEVPIEE